MNLENGFADGTATGAASAAGTAMPGQMPPNNAGPEPAGADRAGALAEALFRPRAIALIGQSDDPGKTTGRPLRFLRRAGFAGAVYPVNPRRGEVLGERAWPALEALPEVPEHAYVITPAEAAVAAVAACARLGVRVVTVLADGFGEAGAAGRARQARLAEIAATTATRIVGPSSLGIVNLRNGALITANAAFDEADLPTGRIFAASHSGGMIGTLLSRGKACGIGFAGLVSVGGEVDLSLGEICAATLDDGDIDGYLLFLESLRHAPQLADFARRAAARGRPVLAYKLGRSREGRELALTHTGALSGEDDVASAFLRDCGIARVETLSALIEGLPLIARVPPRAMRARSGRRPAAAVVTTTAGGAATVVDPLAGRGVEVAAPSPATLARFAAAGIAVAPARLVDLTLAGTRYDVMTAALDILTTAPEYDVVVAVVGSSARFHPELAVQPIIDSAAAGKPIAVFLVPEAPQARAALAGAGVASFYTPEACADAVAAALLRRPPRIAPGTERLPPPSDGEVRTLDEVDAYALFHRLGIRHAEAVALDAGDAPPALSFGFPVALKVLSAAIIHKSDHGGVVLNIADHAALATAIGALHARLPQAGRVLVQPMITGVGEALLGYRIDPDAGPLVMVAAGGIATEIYRDRSLRLAPVDVATAQEMIAEVKGLAALAGGWRGREAGDLAALADALAALSQLAFEPSVLEAEINPMIVRPKGAGVVAVDGVVRLR